MANHFFAILPDDVQIHVLTDWLGDDSGLIRSLSCMDRACCSPADRASMKQLFSQLPPLTPKLETPPELAVEYMQWLCSRRVGVRVLHVAGDGVGGASDLLPALQLAAVESIIWSGTRQFMEVVLRSCPNVTSLEFDQFGFCSSSPIEFTPALVALMPKLTTLINGGAVSYRLLKAIGPQLKELRHTGSIDGNRVRLISTFPLLEGLELEMRTAEPTAIITAVNACENLRDLHLWSCEFSEEDIAAILVHKRIRSRLTVVKRSTAAENCQMLANLMSRFPDMEYLCLISNPGSKKCCYSRDDGKLELAAGHNRDREMSGPLMTQLLNACPSVRLLTICKTLLHRDAVEVIKRKLGNSLERFSLIIQHYSANLFRNLLICGRLLHRIVLMAGDITDKMLGTIAACCPQLESLQLKRTASKAWPEDSDEKPTATDAGLGMLFGACQKLNEVSLTHTVWMPITKRTLQTILDHKLRLKTLNLYGTNIEQHEIDWFCQQVRAYLLPVTAVTITLK